MKGRKTKKKTVQMSGIKFANLQMKQETTGIRGRSPVPETKGGTSNKKCSKQCVGVIMISHVCCKSRKVISKLTLPPGVAHLLTVSGLGGYQIEEEKKRSQPDYLTGGLP